MVEEREGEGSQHRDDRVSLAPLTPEEALRALLAVKPEKPPTVSDPKDTPQRPRRE